MKKKKISLEKKVVIAEIIFVVGILIYVFFTSAPSQISPLQGMTILEPDFVFEIENGEEVWISTNEEFSNPIILSEDGGTSLPPGVYYWKVKSLFRESEIKTFTIQGHVGLNLKTREENYEIQNSGNVDLDVTKKNEESMEDFVLEIGESEEFEKDDSSYEGVQK